MFRDCSLSWKFRYIDKLQPETVEALNKGSILHDIFEKYFDYNDMDITLKELNIDPEFVNTYGKHISNFLNFARLGNFTPLYREHKIEFPNVVGVVDLIVKDHEGKICLIDYKTSTGNSIRDYYDELLLYVFLAEKYFGLKIDKIGIFFSGNGHLILDDVRPNAVQEEIKLLEDEVSLYEGLINKNAFVPQPSFKCKWCGFKQQCPQFNKGEKNDNI